jgi:hemoglobin
MNTPYQILGGEGIKQLCEAFYETMEAAHEAAGIRRMHAEDLAPVTDKLIDYLTDWMGGPPIYQTKYGTVCLTEPHAGYAIGPKETTQWLFCMDQALDKIGASDEVKEMLKVPLERVANAVQNRDVSVADSMDRDPNLIAIN